MKQIIVAEEKHCTRYFDASTPEEWANSSLRILTERWEEGYWYHDPNAEKDEWAKKRYSEYEQASRMSSDEIESLPEPARLAILRLLKEAKRKHAADKQKSDWYTAAKRVVDNQDTSLVTVGRGRYARQVPVAWRLLEERSDHEYERVELEELE